MDSKCTKKQTNQKNKKKAKQSHYFNYIFFAQKTLFIKLTEIFLKASL
jgi:hypothetical protein